MIAIVAGMLFVVFATFLTFSLVRRKRIDQTVEELVIEAIDGASPKSFKVRTSIGNVNHFLKFFVHVFS